MDVRIAPWRRLITEEWCFWTVVLEKTLDSPLDCEEMKPVNPKGNQPGIFIGRADAEAEAVILRPPDAKDRLIRKNLDGGKDWRQQEKGTIEDELVGWHYRLSGHEFEQCPGDGEVQGCLACCSSGVTKNQTWLSDWITILNYLILKYWLFISSNFHLFFSVHFSICCYIYILILSIFFIFFKNMLNISSFMFSDLTGISLPVFFKLLSLHL